MGNGTSIEKLFKGLDVEIKGNKNLVITGICANSKFASPGNLFIAKKGLRFDATEFIPEAAKAGAAAILTDLYNPFFENLTQIIHSSPASIEHEIANRYFNDPSKDLFLVGITGTNGKTTTAYLIKHLLHSKESPCALMGTIENITPLQVIPSELTTSDIVTNQKFLREICDQGAKSAVMETTSHALDQGRVKGIDFDAAIFTNFSQDHLDYHGDMETYLLAKAKLFTLVDHPEKIAILNADDPASEAIYGLSKAKRITYGIQKEADFTAGNITTTLEGSQFSLHCAGKSYSFKTPLIGIFNIYNILAALALGHQKGLSIQTLQRKMALFAGVPGRLERIQNEKGIHLFVDFAHTHEALANVLGMLEKMKQNKLITIFGCGGDRDRIKRPIMAQVAEKFSDLVIITSDNPRNEDPSVICQEMEKGLQGKNYLIEVDRRKAIEKGIALAEPGDTVLIAGRGHEPFQKIGSRLISFDDRKVAREICNLSSRLVECKVL